MTHDRLAHGPLPDRGTATPMPVVDEPAAFTSWKFIAAFAKDGTGKASELPFHASQSLENTAVIDLLPQVAKHTAGDIVLECASILKRSLAEQIDLALGAQKPITNAALLYHLRNQSPTTLATLAARQDLMDKLRRMFPGPLGHVLPVLQDVPSEIAETPPWIKWYVETTDPTVAALYLARTADAVSSLDSLHAWGWLDHLHVEGGGLFDFTLEVMRDKTKDAGAKAKLTALTKGYIEEPKDQVADAAKAQVELKDQLDKNDDVALLDAAARTRTDTKADPKRVAARLAGRDVGIVFEYVRITNVDVKTGIELLLASKGPHAEAVRAFLRAAERKDVVAALADDKMRNSVRKAVGRDVGLRELFDPTPGLQEALHPMVLEHEALRQWVYEDKHAANKLWLAAGSGAGARKGCRLVKAERGMDWVEHIPFDTDQKTLERFVLNCTDAKATKLVRDRYLHESSIEVDASENATVEIDQATYGQGDKVRVKAEIGQQDTTPASVLARIADLTPSDRHALLDDAREMRDLFTVVGGDDAVRAVHLMAPTVAQLLALPIVHEPGLVSYVAARPAKEDVAALATRKLLVSARAMFAELSPLVVFPSLRDPAMLATALNDNADLLAWILDDSDPNYALATLSRDPVRAIAADLIETRASAYQGFPAYAHLSPEGQRGIDAITSKVADADTKSSLTAYREGDVVIASDDDKRGQALEHASRVPELWNAITELDKASSTKANMLELVRRAPSAQQVALLDGSHTPAVDIVRRKTQLGPQHVFPALPLAQLLALSGAADWFVQHEAPTVVFASLAAQPAALKPFATYLQTDANHGAWVGRLPRGGALIDAERYVLDELCKYITDPVLLKALFRARFDVVIGGTFDFDEIKRLWSIGKRLPPAQMNQHAMRAIVEKDLKPTGQWNSPDIELSDKAERFEPKTDMFNLEQKLTADEVKKYYGLNDQELATIVKKGDGWIQEVAGLYTIRPIPWDGFTSTVLHEIGHSIDTLLGEHTDLVFGTGGWRMYGIDQFDKWADEMGGLDAIDAKDRPKVIDAWKAALRSGAEVRSLVDSEHPATASKYAASPLVKAAIDGRTFHYDERDKPILKGRAFIQNAHITGRLASLPEQTYKTAPSQYSLYNAPEFFAESYVEYYRLYDGTPNTEKLKGGRLASWIKTWFDQYVDKIRLSPARVRSPATK